MNDQDTGVTKEEFQEKLNLILMGEVMRLRLKVALLEKKDVEGMADEVIGFMDQFVGIFPPHLHDQLKRMYLAHLSGNPEPS